MLRKPIALPIAAGLLLCSCVSMPTGPSVLVLPGTGRNFDQFRSDDVICRQFAALQTGHYSPAQAAAMSGVGTAAVGTALGAATGAAIGGGEGAAVGSGIGLATGSMAGASVAADSAYEAQERYDIAYIQCMYAHGNRVPVSGQLMYEDRQGARTPTSANIPPPPPNTPPPPRSPR